MKRQREKQAHRTRVSPHSPRDWDRSAPGRHCVIIPPKETTKSDLRLAKKKTNKIAFLQQIIQITNKFISKQT